MRERGKEIKIERGEKEIKRNDSEKKRDRERVHVFNFCCLKIFCCFELTPFDQ